MASGRFLDIESVAVESEYFHRCGTELVVREFEDGEATWCPECEHVLSRSDSRCTRRRPRRRTGARP